MSRSVLEERTARPSTMSPTDTLQAIHRQTIHLQQEIQALLDAQSVGLSAGLGQESDHGDDRSYPNQALGPIHLPVSTIEGSFSRKSPSRMPRRISLSTSRKTLYLSLVQLSELKREEYTVLDSQYQTLNGFLGNISKAEEKRTQIESSITKIETEIEDSDESLASEEATLVTEIAALQKRLDESTSRLKHVRSQRQESSNRQRARLSSWQGALDGVNQQLQSDIISGHGLEDIIPELRVRKSQNTNEGVWSLPKKRRTIGLIKDEISERVEKLLKTRKAAELESIACADGAEIWATVVEKVEKIEQTLSKELEKPTSGTAYTTGQSDAESGMIEIIRTMSETIEYLEKELDNADTNRWNLLVCAVGAELEALNQGRDLLQETLGSVQAESTPGTLSMMTAKSRLASDLADGEENDHLRDSSLLHYRNNSHGEEAQLIDASEDNLDSAPQPLKSANGEQFSQGPSHVSSEQQLQLKEDENEDAPGPEFFY